MKEGVEIIAVGDEILKGEVMEYNSTYLSRALTGAGLEPRRIVILPDDLGPLSDEIAKAVDRSTVVIVTGGLGPTVDDVTKEAAVRALGCRMETREEIVEGIESRFRELGCEMPDSYRDQGRVPVGAEVLPNSIGAAAGLRMSAGGSELYLLPGVPAEMKAIFVDSVLPRMESREGGGRVRLRTFGLMETEVQDMLGGILDAALLEGLSIISDPSGVDVYLRADLDSGRLKDIERELGSHLYATDDSNLEHVVVDLLNRGGKTLSVAESVTGGLVADLLVSVPGASRCFLEGLVAYSDSSKVERLGVMAEAIERYGAVSREVCMEMAAGAAGKTGSDFALATTGIAGPAGETAEKPVGLCFVALTSSGASYCRELKLAGDRNLIRRRAAYRALDLLRLKAVGAEERLEEFRDGRS